MTNYKSAKWMAKIRKKRGHVRKKFHHTIKLKKDETYLQAFDEKIQRRVPHVVRHGVAYSLASNAHFKLKHKKH